MASAPHRSLDGSYGEGGGQILRNAAALAGLLRQNIVVHNIRAGRKQPGLRAQHVASLRLVADLCGGTLTGATIQSTEIQYIHATEVEDGVSEGSAIHTKTSTHPVAATTPGTKSGTFHGEIGTAGSICLLLQAALPCALFAADGPVILDLRGGTNGTLAPQYDYWEHVFVPALINGFGLDEGRISATLKRRGYVPKGGGQVLVTVQPASMSSSSRARLRPINWVDPGHVVSIYIRSFHAGSTSRQFAQELADSARHYVESHRAVTPNNRGTDDTPPLSWRVEVASETTNGAVGRASGVLIVATTSTGCVLGGSALGTARQSAHETGEAAAKELCASIDNGGCVDDWLQDQLILYMALAQGESNLRTGSLTLHTRTAIWVAENLTGITFEVERIGANEEAAEMNPDPDADGRIPGMHMIRCRGIGLSVGEMSA